MHLFLIASFVKKTELDTRNPKSGRSPLILWANWTENEACPSLWNGLSKVISYTVKLPLLGYIKIPSQPGRITKRWSCIISSLIDLDHTVLSLLRDDMLFKIEHWKTLHSLLTFSASGMGHSPKDSLIFVIYEVAGKGPLDAPDLEMGCAKCMCGYSAGVCVCLC